MLNSRVYLYFSLGFGSMVSALSKRLQTNLVIKDEGLMGPDPALDKEEERLRLLLPGCHPSLTCIFIWSLWVLWIWNRTSFKSPEEVDSSVMR